MTKQVVMDQGGIPTTWKVKWEFYSMKSKWEAVFLSGRSLTEEYVSLLYVLDLTVALVGPIVILYVMMAYKKLPSVSAINQ